MANSFFQFKQFIIHQGKTAMKVTTDACLFGAVISNINENKADQLEVLDIGTGTGLLSLMFNQNNKHSNIDAIEIDKEAYEQAGENFALSEWKNITPILADVKTFEFKKKYDLIFSNPPFYEKELSSIDKKKNIAHHGSGLLFEELCQVMQSNLKPEGKFYLLLPFKRETQFDKIMAENNLFIHEKLYVKQTTNHSYFRIIISGGLTKSENIITNEISICDDKKEYSTAFTALLKDYYLYL